jgi:hypothetical protein
MNTFFAFAAVTITTIVALFTALAIEALLLRATLALLEPRAAARRIAPPAIERGTQRVAQAFAKAR